MIFEFSKLSVTIGIVNIDSIYLRSEERPIVPFTSSKFMFFDVK